MGRREKLLFGLDVRNSLGMEIGALCNPLLDEEEGEVVYVDYTDTATLRERYKNDPNVDVNRIVNVTAIWGDNTLSQALGRDRTVDFIVASHVIEHVPDLVTWIRELGSVLSERGEVRLIVPDRRFTFDYLREETRLSEVINAYLLKTRIPISNQILDFMLNKTDVDIVQAWNGTLNENTLHRTCTFDAACNIANDATLNGTYHDVHCWVFTPKSFATLMYSLADLGLIDFECKNYFDTEQYTFEFFVSMRPSNDKVAVLESWKRMIDGVSDIINHDEVSDLSVESVNHVSGNEEIEFNLQQLKIAKEEVESKYERLTSDNDSLLSELQECRQRIDSLSNSLAECHTEARRIQEEFRKSTSWRITAPFRSFMTFIRNRPG